MGTVRRTVLQRSVGTRQHGSRTSRWLSDSDEETVLNGSNPHLDSAEEEEESDEEFTLSRRLPPPKKSVGKKLVKPKSGKGRYFLGVGGS